MRSTRKRSCRALWCSASALFARTPEMCGICGYVGIREDGLLEAMTDALIHRGPDSAGYFKRDDVGLGHRRLSIIDVAGGHQPIENEDGSLVLICNGEIYNY